MFIGPPCRWWFQRFFMFYPETWRKSSNLTWAYFFLKHLIVPIADSFRIFFYRIFGKANWIRSRQALVLTCERLLLFNVALAREKLGVSFGLGTRDMDGVCSHGSLVWSDISCCSVFVLCWEDVLLWNIWDTDMTFVFLPSSVKLLVWKGRGRCRFVNPCMTKSAFEAGWALNQQKDNWFH